MKPKCVAVISYHTCPLSDEKNAEVGGMNIYVLELSKALANLGWQLDIYTRCVDKNCPGVVTVQTNLRVIHLQAGKPVEIPKKQLNRHLGEFTRNLINFIKKEKLTYDLISSHYYFSGLIGLELKRKLKIPLIVTFHTLALMKNLVGRGDEREDLGRVKAELLLTKKADQIIATSRADLEYIHALYNCPLKKIVVLTPGINLELFKPVDKLAAKKNIKAGLNHKLLLFVGRIVPLKGLDVLLYAIKILIKKNPGLTICLWIIGTKSEESNRLLDLRKILKIEAFVKFIGPIDYEKLADYYYASEVAILPSQYESFGITALEAMACGVPVITTDVAGVSHLLDKKHSSLLTSASNPIMLARKIHTLLTDNKEHQKMSREVSKKVQDLSWENVAQKFIFQVEYE